MNVLHLCIDMCVSMNGCYNNDLFVIFFTIRFSKEFEKGKISNMMALDLVPFCMHGTKFYANTTRVPGHEVDRYKYTHHSKVYHNVVLRYLVFYDLIISSCHVDKVNFIRSKLLKKMVLSYHVTS